jgi:hyperosmotically inducible periplasmic protein
MYPANRQRCACCVRLQHISAQAVQQPKEIAMRTLPLLRKSIAAAGAMTLFAALPLSMAMAQQTTPQSSSAMQQQPPSQSSMQQQAPASSSTSSSNETVPGKANDTWITTKVKSKFAAAKGIKASDISVSTTDGAVTLTGTATSSKEKTHAIHLAKQVKGVKSVDATGLTVTSSPSSSSSSGGSSSGGGTQ